MTISTNSIIDELGRSSRRAALLSLLAFIIVMGSLIFAFINIRDSQIELARLKEEISTSQQTVKQLRDERYMLQSNIADARQDFDRVKEETILKRKELEAVRSEAERL